MDGGEASLVVRPVRPALGDRRDLFGASGRVGAPLRLAAGQSLRRATQPSMILGLECQRPKRPTTNDVYFDTAASCRTVLMKVFVARVNVRSRR